MSSVVPGPPDLTSAGTEPNARRRNAIAIAILIAIPSLFFLDVLLGWSVLYTRDVAFYHLPGKKVLRDIVLAGEFPYWNVFLSAGQPLAANPAHGVFYPLTWLILLPDFLYGFQLHALSHVYIAAFGMYALLRSLGTARASAVIGGISFGVGGLMLSGLQLFPFLFSGAWMPWVCLFTRRFLEHRRPRDFALATVMFSMQLLIGEPVTVLQTGFILGMYALFRGERSVRRMARDVAFVGAISVAALFTSAVQTLPLLDHYRDSVRANGFEFQIVRQWSTPPIRLGELVFPMLMGNPRTDTAEPYWGDYLYGRGGPFFQSLYPGLFIAALCFAGIVAGLRGRALLLSIGLVSLILAVGTHTPLLRWMYDIGLARSIRYPEKFVMAGIFAMVVFGVLAFDALLRGDARIRRIAIAFVAATVVVALIAAALASVPAGQVAFRAIWSVPHDEAIARELSSSRTGWIVAAIRGGILVILLVAMSRLRRGVALTLIGLFVTVDLAMLVPEIVPRSPRAFYTDAPRVLEELAQPRDPYRVFLLSEWTHKTPSGTLYMKRRPHAYVLFRNGLPGRSPETYGIRTVMGVDFDLTALTVTDDFQRAAWDLQKKMPRDWLSHIAAMSNIEYVGVFRPLPTEAARSGRDVRYIRTIRFVPGGPSPRYYFAPEIVTARSRGEFVEKVSTGRYSKQAAYIEDRAFVPDSGKVLRWGETANTARIEVESAGNAFLVMSVTAHKYWRVGIDGTEVPAITTNRTYQGIVVPGGRHVVTMRYHNPLIAAGAAISLAAVLALAFAGRR